MSLHAGTNSGSTSSGSNTSAVFGPASSTLNAAAVWNNTTATLLADSRVIVTPPAGTATATITIPANVTVTGPNTSGTLAILPLAQTFTATQTVNPAANTSGVVIGAYSLTGGNAQSLLDLSGTLNTTGSPDVIALRITDTARGANTKFLNLYGGTSGTTTKFSVDNSGNLTAQGTINAAAALQVANTLVIQSFSIGELDFGAQIGTPRVKLYANADAVMHMGAADAAAPVAQTLGVQGARAGTDSNIGGGNFTILSGLGTGTGTVSQLLLQSPVSTTAGSTAQVAITGLSILEGYPVVTPNAATPSGGSVSAKLLFGSTTAFGIYYGSGAPTVAAATGSLYLRSDGSTVATRAYISSTANGTWTAISTVG